MLPTPRTEQGVCYEGCRRLSRPGGAMCAGMGAAHNLASVAHSCLVLLFRSLLPLWSNACEEARDGLASPCVGPSSPPYAPWLQLLPSLLPEAPVLLQPPHHWPWVETQPSPGDVFNTGKSSAALVFPLAWRKAKLRLLSAVQPGFLDFLPPDLVSPGRFLQLPSI